MIIAMTPTTMYVIRSVVVAKFDGAVVAVGVGVTTVAALTNALVAADELP